MQPDTYPGDVVDGLSRPSGQSWTMFFWIFVAIPVLMVVFRRKYPRWWFDWNLELQRFGNRIVAYLALVDDGYPVIGEHQSVHLDYRYPDAAVDLNR